MVFHKVGLRISLPFGNSCSNFRRKHRLVAVVSAALLVLLSTILVDGNPEPDSVYQQIKWPWSSDSRDVVTSPPRWDWIPQTNDKNTPSLHSHHHNIFGDDDDDLDDMGSSVESIAIGVGVFILVGFAVTCLVCFCCPICIIAKMRQRRRGQVYRTAIVTVPSSNGNTNTRNNTGAPATITTGLHVQNAVSPNPNSVNCIAIANNSNRSSPYPVQESVTVVPVITAQQPQPQPQPQYFGQNQQPYHTQLNHGYQTQAPAYPMSNMPNDLPPPYPGLPREMDSSNLPYNPYFSGDSSGNPSAPPSAPPPSKQ